MNRLCLLIWISEFYALVASTYFRHSRGEVSRCDESLYSVQEEVQCPSDEAEWKERAEVKKCETFSQNCTEAKKFVYHCLINAWKNGTIEVCAPEVSISGKYCAEFNKGGARVQAQYASKCNSCPYTYNSSQSYNYQYCYKLVSKSFQIPEITESTRHYCFSCAGRDDNSTDSTEKKNNVKKGLSLGVKKAISALILTIFILFLMLVILFQCHVLNKYDCPSENYSPLMVSQPETRDTKALRSRGNSQLNHGSEI